MQTFLKRTRRLTFALLLCASACFQIRAASPQPPASTSQIAFRTAPQDDRKAEKQSELTVSEAQLYTLLKIMPEQITFTSEGRTLHGYVYKPRGKGPFPALLWNHGSERQPGSQPHLAKFYTDKGFVFFIPHRHGHGLSPGEYIGDAAKAYDADHPDKLLREKYSVELHERYNKDVVAALAWLKSQSFVKPRHIVVSGLSYGGIQTLLTAQKGLGVRACIPFAPGAMSWANTELQKRELEAVRKAKMPLFLLQAENDYSIGPSETLGPVIEQKGSPNRAKLYPAFGTTNEEGHVRFATKPDGIAIWGADVMDFIHAAMPDMMISH